MSDASFLLNQSDDDYDGNIINEAHYEEIEYSIKNDHHCLLCGIKSSKELSVPCEVEKSLLPGSEGYYQLNQQLLSVFILKNLLAYPVEEMSQLLKNTDGLHPSDWFVLCSCCTKFAQDAMKVHLHILKLEWEFKKLRKEATIKIASSVLSEDDSSDLDISTGRSSKFKIGARIREYYRNEDDNIEVKEESDENDSLVDNDYFHHENEMRERLSKSVETASRESLKQRSRVKVALPSSSTTQKKGHKLKCQLCTVSRVYTNTDSYKWHLNKHQTNRHPCPTCNFPCSSESSLKRHQSRDLCFAKFQRKQVNSQNLEEPTTLVNDNENSETNTEPSEFPIKVENDGGLEKEDFDSQSGSESELSWQNDDFDCDDVQDTMDPLYIPPTLRHTDRRATSNSLRIRREHMKRKGHNLKCTICTCKRVYTNTDSYRRHMESHVTNKYPCPTCQYPCASELLRRNHLRKRFCFKSFFSKKRINSVTNLVDQGTNEIKDSSEKQTINHTIEVEKTSLKHASKSTPAVPMPSAMSTRINRTPWKGNKYFCAICTCNRVYTNLYSFRRHMEKHVTSKYPCPTCQYPCASDLLRRSHLRKRNCFKSFIIKKKRIASFPSLADRVTNATPSGKGTRINRIPCKGNKLYCTVCTCNRVYTNKYSYIRHMESHVTNKYPCPTCQYPCASELLRRNHLRKRYCFKSFFSKKRNSSITNLVAQDTNEIKDTSEEQDMDHSKEVEENPSKITSESTSILTMQHGGMDPKISQIPCEGNNLSCAICTGNHVYANKKSYKRHMHRHATLKYSCPNCKNPCASESALKIHLKRKICNKKFPFSKKDENLPGSSESDIIKAKVSCSAETEVEKNDRNSEDGDKAGKGDDDEGLKDGWTQEDLNDMKMSAEEEWISCDVCSLRFRTSNRVHFDYHVKRHHYFENCEVIDGKLKCKVCGHLAAGPLHLRRHTRKNHASELGIPVFQCDLCDKSFARKTSLKAHVAQIHSKKCKYFCEVCGYGAMQKTLLEIHMLSHDNVRSYVCELCAATFKTKTTLQNHIRKVHESSRGKGEFKCKFCVDNTVFTNKSLLQRHLKDIHKNLYVHKCDECENSYLSVASLQLHKKVNHGGQQAECPFCHVKVRNRVYLYTHYKYCSEKPPGFKYTFPRSADAK